MSKLTPEEQAELDQLETEEKGGWSADEDAELAALEKEFGGEQPQEQSLLSKAGDTASDFLTSIGDNVPVLGAAANYVGNKADVALGFAKDDAEAEANMRARQAARAERSPIADTAGSVVGASTAMAVPGAGLAGVGSGLAVSGADLAARKGLTGEDISLEDAGKQLLLEGGIGGALVGAGKALKPLSGKTQEISDALAQKFGKRSLGGTKSELRKLEVESDTLDNVVRRLREDGVYDKALQSSDDLYENVKGMRQASGAKGNDIFMAGAQDANQAEVYQSLMARAKVAQDRGQGEIAAKLRSEADNIKAISSNPLDTDLPIQASPEQLKLMEMQNTSLDPSVIKERKTFLDKDTFKSKVETNQISEAAGDEMRDLQYGLMDGDSAAALKAENAKYGDLKTGEKLLANKAAGEQSSGGGLIKKVRQAAFVSGAMASGGLPVAAAAYVGDAFLSKYGNQLATYGFNKGSKVLQNPTWVKALEAAGDRGGIAGVNTAHFLMTQRDPEYRKAHQEDQDASKDQ